MADSGRCSWVWKIWWIGRCGWVAGWVARIRVLILDRCWWGLPTIGCSGDPRWEPSCVRSPHVRHWEVDLGAGPGVAGGCRSPNGAVTVDLDSICAVSGKTKQAAYGYTKELGYHPLLAFRADTGEVVGARLREGSSQRGVVHFTRETIRRVRRAQGPGERAGRFGVLVHASSALTTSGWAGRSPALNAKVRAQISNIDKDAWVPIDYPRGGQAQVGETAGDDQPPETVAAAPGSSRGAPHRFPSPAMARLYHTLVTNLDLAAAEADQHHQPGAGQDDTGHQPRGEQVHRRTPVEIEANCPWSWLPSADLSGGLAHLPSGVFAANAAWLLCAALAHNLYRHIALLGGTHRAGRLVCGRTIRTRLFGVPGRVVNHGGRRLVRLPARWPWAGTYLTTLTNLGRCPNSANPAPHTRHNHNQPPKPQPHTPETTPTSLQHHLTHQTTPITALKPPKPTSPDPSTSHQPHPGPPPGEAVSKETTPVAADVIGDLLFDTGVQIEDVKSPSRRVRPVVEFAVVLVTGVCDAVVREIRIGIGSRPSQLPFSLSHSGRRRISRADFDSERWDPDHVPGSGDLVGSPELRDMVRMILAEKWVGWNAPCHAPVAVMRCTPTWLVLQR